MSGTMITISNEGDKLIIARKPALPTQREKLFGCGCQILVVVLPLFAMGIGFFNSGNEDLFITFLIVAGIIAVVLIILIIRDKFRHLKPIHPPDYENEIHTFDTNQFEVQHRGEMHAFSYRFETRPVLRQSTYSTYKEVIIPCNPLYDHVPKQFRWGFYCIWSLDSGDAERIFESLKEHLEKVKSLGK